MTIDEIVQSYTVDVKTYPDKAVIIKEGSEGDWVYKILEGCAKIKKRTPKGMVTLDTFKEGDIFGEMALLETGKGVRTASVVAANGPVRVGILDPERLARDYDTVSPELKRLIGSLTIRLKEASERICEMVAASKSKPH
jgi:CRP-like cAMP-binding protein